MASPSKLALEVVRQASTASSRRPERKGFTCPLGSPGLSEPLAEAFALTGSDFGVLPWPPRRSSDISSSTSDEVELARSRLAASVLDWMLRSEKRIWPLVAEKVFSGLGLTKPGEISQGSGTQLLAEELAGIDSHVSSKTFLCCERPTAADAAVSAALLPLFRHAEELTEGLEHLRRWQRTMIAQEAFQKALGQPEFSHYGREVWCYACRQLPLIKA